VKIENKVNSLIMTMISPNRRPT